MNERDERGGDPSSRRGLEADAAPMDPLRGVVQALPQPVLLLDSSQRIVAASNAWVEVSGDATPPEGHATFADAYGHLPGLSDAVASAAEGKAARVEGVTLGAGADTRDYGVEARPWFHGPGDRGGVVVIVDDDAALRRAEAKLARSHRDLQKFVYVASHDLKSPLHGVSQLLEFMEEDLGEAVQGEIAEHLQHLKRRVGNMRTLLGDLLRFSRAGATEPWVALDLSELVDDIVAELGLADLQITLVDETAGRPMPALGVRQVLHNLLENAAAHAGPTARVEIRAGAEGDGLTLVVEDDGPGIDAELQASAFELFQTQQARGRSQGGGVGLAVVRRIAEQHGGTVVLESPCVGERGTRLRITLTQRP